MTAEQIKTLQALAATLPKCSQRVVRKYTGQQLMDLGYELWEGGAIRPERMYMVDTIIGTNHVRMLARVLEHKGERAMLDLVHRLRGGHAQSIAA